MSEAAEAYMTRAGDIGPMLVRAESPVERAFLAAFIEAPTWSIPVGWVTVVGATVEVNGDGSGHDFLWRVWSNYTLDIEGITIRPDVLIEASTDGRPIGLACIEVDGLSYHRRNNSAAERDFDRDRRLLRAGIPVLRYSAEQVRRDAVSCAREAWETLLAWSYSLNRLERAGKGAA